MESARGCKYHCRFCYSPGHWQRARDFLDAPILADFKKAIEIGTGHVFLVQDNLLNNPHAAASLCLNLADLSPKPTWNCYGTLRDISFDLADYLARGGCTSIYIGVDAATPAQKREFGKSAFRSREECFEKVELLVAKSVIPTCALILDPIHWDDTEIEESFRLAVALRLAGAELSLHFLNRYSNTALGRHTSGTETSLHDQFRIRLMFDCPEVVVNNPFAGTHPSLFPFHTRNTLDPQLYNQSVALIHLGQHLISCYPHELWDLVSNHGARLIDIIRDVYSHVSAALWKCPQPALTKAAAAAVLEEILCLRYNFIPVNETH